jgi:hypothetical protein
MHVFEQISDIVDHLNSFRDGLILQNVTPHGTFKRQQIGTFNKETMNPNHTISCFLASCPITITKTLYATTHFIANF